MLGYTVSTQISRRAGAVEGRKAAWRSCPLPSPPRPDGKAKFQDHTQYVHQYSVRALPCLRAVPRRYAHRVRCYACRGPASKLVGILRHRKGAPRTFHIDGKREREMLMSAQGIWCGCEGATGRQHWRRIRSMLSNEGVIAVQHWRTFQCSSSILTPDTSANLGATDDSGAYQSTIFAFADSDMHYEVPYLPLPVRTT